MLVLVVFGIALVLSLLTGGRLRNALNWRLRGLPIALAVFVLQTLLFTERGVSFVGEPFVPVLYIATMGILFAFLFLNRRVPGVQVLLAGLMLNMLVIGANGGRMPASSEALTRAGRIAEAQWLQENVKAANCILMSTATRLNALGDYVVIRLNSSVGSAYSIGDLVALTGEGLLIFFMVRTGSDRFPERKEASSK